MKYLLLSSIIALFVSCGEKDNYKINGSSQKSYTVNFDGSTTYGTFDTPWTPTGANWEIEVELIWDSSQGGNVYPIATNSSVTSIYIDSGGLPLLKYENQYITANVTRLEHNKLGSFKFSVSATEVKCYMNDVLENTVATTKTLSVPWTVVGAHSTYINKLKGQIRKITLTDLDDDSNSRVLNLVMTPIDESSLSSTTLRDSTGIDFTLPASNSFIEI
ncbi:MAG: hypothetical protein KC478_12470 [Bacteriovoracaceae bacterium]|nr:hypothetical protein [Bacteriovoracaceae bacterium]